MDPQAALFALGFLGGAFSGLTGFGAGWVLFALLGGGLPFVQSLAMVKLQAALSDVSAAAAFSRAGRLPVRGRVRALLWTTAGAAVAAWCVQAGAVLIGVAVLACAVGAALLCGRATAREHATRRLAPLLAGAYIGGCGIAAGSLLTGLRWARGGVGYVDAHAYARAIGAVANLAAVTVFILGDAMPWGWALPLAAGLTAGSYVGARCMASIPPARHS